MLRLKTFGGLWLEGDEGPLTGAAARRRRLVLLAALAAAGQKGMSRDAVVGLLWPEVDEPRARAALSQSLYALKRDTGVDELVLGHDVLTLNSGVVWSDVSDFEAAIARGDSETAANLYSGQFLAGVFLSEAVDFEHWLDGIRLRLSQVAEQALGALAMDAESRRDFAAASNWWRRLLGLDALKTRAVLGLMEALVALGDRAKALRTAERYAQRVREDLDGEPNARIMAYASSLRGTPSRLPVIADEMIGRDDELRVATSLIERSDLSLLTLTGAGGTGKTRLAIQVARAVEPRVDRVWFVDLSALRDSARVIPAVASACGVEPEPGRDPVDGIASSLAGRRVLIVLDNFEQVVDAAGAIARLVSAAPEAKLLVTSRMRLGIRAEHEFFVAPLALPEDPTNIGALRANSSVRLFLRRAAQRIRRSSSRMIPLAPLRESVRGWTDCRWRSSSRQRDAVSCLREPLRPDWNLGWTWCLAVDETCRRVNRRFAQPSLGALHCYPMPNDGCSRASALLPEARPLQLPSGSAPTAMTM